MSLDAFKIMATTITRMSALAVSIFYETHTSTQITRNTVKASCKRGEPYVGKGMPQTAIDTSAETIPA